MTAPTPKECGAPGDAGPCVLPCGHAESFHEGPDGKCWLEEVAAPSLLQGSPPAGSNLPTRLRAALLADMWGQDSPRAAHGQHRYDAGCALCTGDVDAIVATVLRILGRTLSDQETVRPDQPSATGKESIPVRDRIAAAIGDAWPDLQKDPVYLDQLAAVAMTVVEAAFGEAEQRYKGIAEGLVLELRAAVKARGEAEAVLAEQTQRAEQAEARLAELEGALNWQTSCTSCARLLDASYADHERAEQAEAAVQRLRDDLPKLERAALMLAATDAHGALREFAACIRTALDRTEET